MAHGERPSSGFERSEITWSALLALRIDRRQTMGLLGTLLAAPIRILNVPARVIEKLVDDDSRLDDEDNILSKPLEKLAQAVEELVDDE